MKDIYRATPHYQHPNKGRFVFYPRYPEQRSGKFTALEVTRCTETLAAVLEAMPYKVPPVSFLAECIKAVDDFFGNKLSKGTAQNLVCQHAMADAINGCGHQRKWLFRKELATDSGKFCTVRLPSDLPATSPFARHRPLRPVTLSFSKQLGKDCSAFSGGCGETAAIRKTPLCQN